MDLTIVIGGALLFILGIVLGKLDDFRRKRRGDLDVYFWECPDVECTFRIEMHDHDRAVELSVRHMKKVHFYG